MTAVSLLGTVPFPALWAMTNSLSTSVSGALVDASGEKVCYTLRAPKTGSIRKIHWVTTVVTTPTDVDVRIETVDLSTGFPSGSLWAASTNATQASASLASNTMYATTLTADASVTKGDVLAVVIAPSGSPNLHISQWSSPQLGFPLTGLYTTSWSYVGNGQPNVALEYSDGTIEHIPGVHAALTSITRNFSASTNPDERGIRFKVPAPTTVRGAWIASVLQATAGITVKLYDSDGSSVLTSVAIDPELRLSTNPPAPYYVEFPTTVTLLADTYYRLTVLATEASNTSILEVTFANTSVMAAESGGADVHLTTRNDGGAWTNTTTALPLMGVLIDAVDDGTGTGSGGGSLHHGLVPPHHHAGRGRR